MHSESGYIGPHPIDFNLKFIAAVADVISHALVLTKTIITVSNGCNKMDDIVW